MERFKALWHKKNMRRLLFGLTVLLLVCLFAIQPLLSYVLQEASVWPDLTEEGLYTASGTLLATLSGLKQDVTIIFCAAPDYLLGNVETRAPYITCKKLARENPHIKIEIRDLISDPSAADEFKSSNGGNVSWNDVIFTTGAEFRRVSAAGFWGEEEEKLVSFNGEYRIATEILSLTALDGGSYVYFAVGHGERYYVEGDAGSDPSLSAFHELLRELGLRVATVNLDEVDKVPDNCALLIFCGTQVDYDDYNDKDYAHVSSMQKLDEYLARDRSVMVLRDAYNTPLPAFDSYLSEWGLSFNSDKVIAPDSSLKTESGEGGSHLIATYAKAEEDSLLGYGMIAGLSDMNIPPKTVLPNCASINMTRVNVETTLAPNTVRAVSGVFFAGEDAYAVDKDGFKITKPDSSLYWLAAAATEWYLPSGNTNTYYYSYVFAAGTTALIENTYLADSALGNRDAMRSVLRTISRIDVFASSELGGFDLNSKTYGGKMLLNSSLFEEDYTFHYAFGSMRSYPGLKPTARIVWTVLIALLPVVVVPFVGYFVCARRKNR